MIFCELLRHIKYFITFITLLRSLCYYFNQSLLLLKKKKENVTRKLTFLTKFNDLLYLIDVRVSQMIE